MRESLPHLAAIDVCRAVAAVTEICAIGELGLGDRSQLQRRGKDRLVTLLCPQPHAWDILANNSIKYRASEGLSDRQIQRLDAGERRRIGPADQYARDQADQDRQRHKDKGRRAESCRRAGQGLAVT